MPVFAYCIAADQARPSETGVFVRAETIRQAVALVGHPEVNVWENRLGLAKRRRARQQGRDGPVVCAACVCVLDEGSLLGVEEARHRQPTKIELSGRLRRKTFPTTVQFG